VNVALAAIIFAVMSFAGITAPSLGWGFGNGSFLEDLLMVNVVLVLFNLIPAFPMDGGRILRALMATRMDYAQATRYAAWLGQGIAVVFAIAGFFVNPLLVLTALFIFMGAQGETQMAQQRIRMSGWTVGQAMRTNIRALAPYESLASAMDSMLTTAQQDFPIVQNGRVVGLLTRATLLKGLQQLGAYAPISQAMRENVTTVQAEQSLGSAAETMQANELSSVPVLNQGTLVGMLTFDGIREFLTVQKLLKTTPRQPGEIRML
jgi:CBS domain-containing protein